MFWDRFLTAYMNTSAMFALDRHFHAVQLPLRHITERSYKYNKSYWGTTNFVQLPRTGHQ